MPEPSGRAYFPLPRCSCPQVCSQSCLMKTTVRAWQAAPRRRAAGAAQSAERADACARVTNDGVAEKLAAFSPRGDAELDPFLLSLPPDGVPARGVQTREYPSSGDDASPPNELELRELAPPGGSNEGVRRGLTAAALDPYAERVDEGHLSLSSRAMLQAVGRSTKALGLERGSGPGKGAGNGSRPNESSGNPTQPLASNPRGRTTAAAAAAGTPSAGNSGPMRQCAGSSRQQAPAGGSNPKSYQKPAGRAAQGALQRLGRSSQGSSMSAGSRGGGGGPSSPKRKDAAR